MHSKHQVNVSNQNLKRRKRNTRRLAHFSDIRGPIYFPTVTVDPLATRNKFAANRPPHSHNSVITFTDYRSFRIVLTRSISGRVRRTVESYRAQAQLSAADLAG